MFDAALSVVLVETMIHMLRVESLIPELGERLPWSEMRSETLKAFLDDVPPVVHDQESTSLPVTSPVLGHRHTFTSTSEFIMSYAGN